VRQHPAPGHDSLETMTQENYRHPIAPPQWQMDAWQARIETMGADVPAVLLEIAQWGAEKEIMKVEPANCIKLNTPTEEVIRIDKEGFHYKGQFIADAGEAHRLMVKFLKQNTAQ